MKVLHVIDALGVGGGAEHSLAALLPPLRDRGVDSAVACLFRRQGGLQARLEGQGFEVTVLPQTWRGRIRGLRQLIREQSPDVVHATLTYSCLVARVSAAGTGTPQVNSLVNTSYDPVRLRTLGIPSWKMQVLRVVDGFTARHLTHHFHAISDAVRAEAEAALGIDPSRITVIPRGRRGDLLGERTTARRTAARQGLGIPPTVPVLLNVGRQDQQKNQAGLIRSFAQVRQSHPDAVLLVAGRDGDASTQIQRALGETDVGDSVRMLGHRDDIPDLCAAADVFVFPSLYEGLGCSLIEAMALSTPIVGSDAAAVAEVLRNGELGIVVPRADQQALASALVGLLDDEQLRLDLGSSGRSEFLERYDLDRVADATVSMYRAVSAGRADRGRGRG